MHPTLQLVLMLLAAAVLVSSAFRAIRLPALLGYLIVGIVIGPHALGWIPETNATRYLADFGVVFLMFSIGLEFSLPRLKAMRGTVFGLGSAQVASFMVVSAAGALAIGFDWRAGLTLGGALALSSTAIVSKMLTERQELRTPHGQKIMGVLLFQDLAVVPLLILVPALAGAEPDIQTAIGWALAKAAVVLFLILFIGQRLMRPWFHLVARQKSSELFVINVLLITLGLAYVTELAGLSLALGAFVAGMLISETEYRYQVEDDIKPFRDVLLGLFFVTVGMRLDLGAAVAEFDKVLAWLVGMVLVKGALIVGLVRLFGASLGVSLRTGIALAQAGEFGFVLLAQALGLGVVQESALQSVLAAMVLSMLAAPVLMHFAPAIVARACANEWTLAAKDLYDIAVKSAAAERHVVVCGYGRSGQSLARLLEAESISFIALDIDPERVRAAAAAGESVVYGDAGRREVLTAAGLSRARALVITFASHKDAMRIIGLAQSMRPDLPIVVRTLDDLELDKLRTAGATEVVPEVLEGSLMLATHALLLLGVPLARVLRRIRVVREARYRLMRGFFRGATDESDELSETEQLRLASVHLASGASAVHRSLGDVKLEELLVDVLAIRRHGIRGLAPEASTRLEEGDVLVLRGTPDALAAAEIRLLQG